MSVTYEEIAAMGMQDGDWVKVRYGDGTVSGQYVVDMFGGGVKFTVGRTGYTIPIWYNPGKTVVCEEIAEHRPLPVVIEVGACVTREQWEAARRDGETVFLSTQGGDYVRANPDEPPMFGTGEEPDDCHWPLTVEYVDRCIEAVYEHDSLEALPHDAVVVCAGVGVFRCSGAGYWYNEEGGLTPTHQIPLPAFILLRDPDDLPNVPMEWY